MAECWYLCTDCDYHVWSGESLQYIPCPAPRSGDRDDLYCSGVLEAYCGCDMCKDRCEKFGIDPALEKLGALNPPSDTQPKESPE